MDDVDSIKTFIDNSLLDFEIQEKWSYSFKGSALPCCPRQLMLGMFYKKTKFEHAVSFSTRYSFHVGRAIHALAQETWARQGLLWGDWVCEDHKNCGVKYTSTRLEGGRCIRCGRQALYIEKEIVDEATGFKGYVDAPVYVPSLDAYVIFELKSRNSNVISKAEHPYESDLYQVSMYASLLARKYWLRIAGRVILWIGKPKPKPYKFWFYPDVGEDLADEQFKLKAELDKKIECGDIVSVEGCCVTPQDADERGCPFAGICLSPVRDRLIQEEYKGWLLGKSN
jgi:hypothetical protein